MNNIFVSWKQKIESRIISDLKSQYTESEEQIRQRKEQFLKKQKKIILIEIIAGAVFLAFLIIRAAFLQDDILLSRNSFGQGSKEVQLSLKKDDKKKEITYKLDEQKLSAEEESKVYIQFFKKLKKIMMKNNTSLKQIQTPLNLPDTVDGYPFEITYELAEDGYIRLDGSINEEEQAKLKRGETYRTYIVVTARYGEYRKSKKYEIRIVPKKNISQTNVFYKIQQYLKKEEQENEYQKSQYCGLESSLEPFSQKFLQQKITEERTELQRMLTPVNTILVLANVVVFMILSFLGNTTDAEFMAAHGAMDWMDVVEKHQYYRLFTSMFLHFGADHLLQNMLILLVIGCRLERITGKLSYLLIYIGAGLIGAGTSIIFTLGNNPNTVSAGASGAIFGVMGGLLYCIISDIIQKKRHRVEEIGLTGMIFMVASALSYGFFSTGIDNAAHIGGLVGGFLITMISRFVI